jgi:uncharacterized protein YjbI with pentapeptide repeats
LAVDLLDKWKDNLSNFIASLSVFLNDPKSKDIVGATGPIISTLIGSAKLIQEYRKQSKSREELAFSDLFEYLLTFTSNFLKENCKRFKIKEEDLKPRKLINNNKRFLKEILGSYKEITHNDFQSGLSWLPTHPLIQKFKQKINEIIPDNFTILKLEFNKRFEDEIETDLYKKESLRDFKNRFFAELYRTKLDEHLNSIIYDYYEYFKGDQLETSENIFSTRHYYHQRDAIAAGTNHWNSTDDEILIEYGKSSKIEDLISGFLKGNTNALLLGSSFGMGKTSLIKRIAYLKSKERLENANDYLPIIIYAKNGLNIEQKSTLGPNPDLISLEKYLSLLFENNFNDDNIKKQKKVLLILDGLDEYSGDLSLFEWLKTELEPKLKEYSNMKVIYTTRLNTGIPFELNFTNYIRLLPFTENQVDEYLGYYNVDFTYQTLISHKLKKEEIIRPLMTWMLLTTFSYFRRDLEILQEQNINIEFEYIFRTLIYLNLFHYITLGKHKDQPGRRKIPYSKYQELEIYFNEQKDLRTIAYYKKIYPHLTERKLKNWSNIKDLKRLDPVLETYFYLKQINDSKSLEFMHQSFIEFLLAEHILEHIISGNFQLLNIGKPSNVTIEFLIGLLNLILTKDRIKEIFKKYVAYDENNDLSLFYLLGKGVNNSDNDFINSIITNSIKFINQESIVVVKFSNENLNIQNYSNLIEQDSSDNVVNWIEVKKEQTEVNDYENLLIYKWISLLTITILTGNLSQSNIEKDKLVKLIRNSSQNVPPYIISLSNANLSYVNLSGINLSRVNLSGTNFLNTILSDANLSGSNLSFSILAGTNLSRSNLTHSKLIYTDFSDTKYRLHSQSRLHFHSLSDANKSSNILLPADMSYANLSEAILVLPNLSRLKLNGTNFSSAIIINPTNYDKPEMNDDTNFKKSFTDDSEFIEYLDKQKCNNLPTKIKNKNILKKMLIEKEIDPRTIKKILDSSKLEY